MKKKFFVIIINLFILALIWRTYEVRKSVTENPKVIKIGVSLPLSGEFATAGEALKNAALFAEDDLNQKSSRYKFQLIIENDGFEAKRTATIFNKLKNIDEVDAVISFASQAGNIIAPEAEKSRMLHINFGASDKRVVEGRYNFVHWTAPATTTKRMLDFYQSRGIKKVAVITANNSGTLSLEEALIKQQAQYPEIKLKTWQVQPVEKDFRMLLAEVRKYEPDAVLILVYGDSVYPFVKQFHQAKIKALLTNIEAFSMLADFRIIEGLYIADVAKDKGKLIERLRKSDKHSSSFGVGNIYDAVQLIAKAFEQAEHKEDAAAELSRIKEYDGMVGMLHQNEEGFFDASAILQKVENAKLVVIND